MVSRDHPPTRAAVAEPLAHQNRRGPGRFPSLAAIAAAILVVTFAVATFAQRGVLFGRGAGPHAATASTGYITPEKDGMRCVVDVAWSPQADRIAVLGYAQNCPAPKDTVGSDHPVAVVSIYDATTLKLLDQLHPDDAIHQSVPSSTNPSALTLQYEGMLWSPDGTSLAFPFVQPHGPFSEVVTVGLVTTSLTHQQTRVYSVVEVAATETQAAKAAEWDLTQAQPALRLVQIPPAYAYAWQSGGALVPVGPRPSSALPAVAAPHQPIGVPTDPSFSIWQPGDARLFPLGRVVGCTLPVLDYYNFWGAWSPDGRYIIIPVSNDFSVAQAGQQGSCALVWFAVRDAALQAVYQALHVRSASADRILSMPIAWRPDGKVLAAWVSAPQSSGSGQAVTMFDCASGKTLATLQPVSEPQFQLVGNPPLDSGAMRWSPDGTHLLLFAPSLGTITIWDLGQLPR
jgi:WD40 repeat protein